MALLDYDRLKERISAENTESAYKLALYSKIGDEYTAYSDENAQALVGILKEKKAGASVGEFIIEGETVLISAGNKTGCPNVLRTNISKAVAKVQPFLKSSSKISFEKCEHTGDMIYSFIISTYSYDFLKQDKSKRAFKVVAPENSEIISIANAQNFARFLGDTPANLMTPRMFVEYAKKFMGELKIDISALGPEEIREKGMNLMLSVSQGSREEPRLLHMKYFGRESKQVDVALVGKGVTFDTGGISLKPSPSMCEMKGDMMGAGTLLAAFKLVAEAGLKINVSATFPLVENMPSSTATKPGDVFISMSGKSVEVDNTDAEGRLILADAITFAQADKPRYLLDAATLTGAMSIALGSVFVGYFTNSNALSEVISSMGNHSNDQMWRMPLSLFYQEALKSNVADLNNMGGRDAGSAKAAEFLHAFVEKDVEWAHFDIAGVMSNSFNSELYGKGMTGKPVRAFYEVMKKLSESKL
ncbi:cytosol aminopeptidase [Enteropsectra breve]|nr:cytosol aminopeptidase [Enteropsectra breve]